MSNTNNDFRIEKDSMGEVKVPASCFYGAQTQRAVENFTISSYKMPKAFINALVLVKLCAAKANCALNLISEQNCNAIVNACEEILSGKYADNFPLDVFQTGSGTSTNMNANEVIANLANLSLGSSLGASSPIHPNDTVNKGQSSNDVIPTSMNISARLVASKLVDALTNLVNVLKSKESEFSSVLKLGRTHLQDAVPMFASDEISSWRAQFEKSIYRIENSYSSLEELALGGTAIGSGLNCKEGFATKAIELIAERTGIAFKQAPNLFEAISARDSILEYFNSLNSLATSIFKIATDLRLLSSGPRCAIGEISLPSLQPGSSIMPGKINPVIPEMALQVSAEVMGMHHSVSIGCATAPLQLNIMMPLIAYQTVTATELLTNCIEALNTKCFANFKYNETECKEKIEYSLAIVTPLALKIGYEKAAKIAYYAFENKIKVSEAAKALTDLSEAEIAEILDINKMV